MKKFLVILLIALIGATCVFAQEASTVSTSSDDLFALVDGTEVTFAEEEIIVGGNPAAVIGVISGIVYLADFTYTVVTKRSLAADTHDAKEKGDTAYCERIYSPANDGNRAFNSFGMW